MGAALAEVVTDTESPARGEALPRVRYRQRLLVELGYDLLLLACFIAGFLLVLRADGLLGCLAGAAVMTVVTIHAVLLFHDCMHQSAYGHRRVEAWVGRAIGAFYGCPFHFLRDEHLRHHRHAGLVDDDPEALHLHEGDAAARPDGPLLARLAASRADALTYTWVLQLGQFARWIRRQLARVENPALVRATALDVAAMLALWIPLTAFLVSRGAYGRVLCWAFIVPAVVGLAIVYKAAKPLHTLMVPFRLPELPYARRQFCVTRSFETHPLVGLLLCNLNHHLEHHLYPQVSRWDLPRVARALRPELEAYARRHELPLAIHSGYAGWARRYADVAATYNPVDSWGRWSTLNRGFDYVSFHAPRREVDA
jgi:fatty acid desaturase